MKFYKLLFAIFIGLPIVCGCDSHNDALCKSYKNTDKENTFRKENNPESVDIDKVSVYVENSGSMDGYVAGNTEFKTDIFNIICKLNAEPSIKEVKKYFVNDQVIDMNKMSDVNFSRNMDAKLFRISGGDRSTSDIAECVKNNVILPTKKNEVSVFISDCVFSPTNGNDIHVMLSQERTLIETALKTKAKSNKNFGVAVYMLQSTFSGVYYNKTLPNVTINEKRPYYVWVFGNFFHLKKINATLKNVLTNKTNGNYYTNFNSLKNVPYYCAAANCNKNRGKHIAEPKVKDGKFSFVVRVDMSSIPLDDKYLNDVNNYGVNNTAYNVVGIAASKKDGYTHELKVLLKSKKSIKENTKLEIFLKRPEIPKWVATYDDPTGDDYMKTPNKTGRTFGLNSYIGGAFDAFKDNIATFKILIK